MNCYVDCKDWILLIIGFGFSVFWALLIFSLRPKIKIGIPILSFGNRTIIQVPINNCSKTRRATKIKVEVAIVEKQFTYHLLGDIDDFAFLPSIKSGDDPERIFKFFNLNNYLSEVEGEDFDNIINKLNENQNYLRVRIHSSDSFSGLGKVVQEKFALKNNQLVKLLK
jgi:hypothetical protein